MAKQVLLNKTIIICVYFFAASVFLSKALSSIIGGIIILLWVLSLIYNKNIMKNKTELDWAILVLIGSFLLSLVDSFSRQSIEEFLAYFLLVLFFYAVSNAVMSVEEIKKIKVVLIVSMTISCLVGLYQKYFLHFQRVKGFMTQLDFGCLLSMISLFLISFIIWGQIKNKYYKIILIFLSILGLLNLILTQSRGAWLGFLVGLVFIFFYQKKKYLLYLLVIILLMAAFLPSQYTVRFKSSFDLYNNRSNLARIALWKGSYLMFLDNPINGVGLGRFKEEYDKSYTQVNTTTSVHAHNNFLHILAETGIVGFFAFIFFIYHSLMVLSKKYKTINNTNHKLFLFASMAAFISFHVQGLTEYNFGDADTGRFFWFLLALNMAMIRLTKQDEYT